MDEQYGAALRRRRLDRGLTQEDLAALAGVSRTTIRNAESGRASEPRLRGRIDLALDRFDEGAAPATSDPVPAEPALVFHIGGVRHHVDHDLWDPQTLTPRDRALCRTLLEYALSRFDARETED